MNFITTAYSLIEKNQSSNITVGLYIINLSLKQFFDLIDWLVERTRFINATIIEKHFMSLTNRLWQLIQKHFFIFINNNFVTPN